MPDQRDEEVHVTGTLIWYYYCCPREVWLMVHQINPDSDDSNMDLGRFIQAHTYPRDTHKEISVGNIRLDLVRQDKDGIVVGEVKKSSKYINSARMQLAFYLQELKEHGVTARGELMFPKEKRKEEVVLTVELERELSRAKQAIEQIASAEQPPRPKKINLCKNCAYHEFCWA